MTGARRRDDHDEDIPGRAFPTAFMLGAVGLVAAGLGSVFAIRHFDLGWTGVAVAMTFMAVGTAFLMRAGARHTRRMGYASPAMARYNLRLQISSMLYMAGLFVALFAYKRLYMAGAVLWLLALLPSIGTLGMIRAMARLIVEETDEYIRLRLAKAALFAIGLVLVVTTIWGFFEQFSLVPHVPSWAVLPIFALSLGVANLARWVRE